MLKPICVKCHRFFHVKKTGFYFIEGMLIANHAPSGNLAPEMWQPYKVWSGDLWECPDCGAEIISGTGAGPLAWEHQPEFAETVVRLNADQFQVNDC